MAKRTLQYVLDNFFDETGEDNTFKFYDIKEGLVADSKRGEVMIIAVSHDRTQFHVVLEDLGGEEVPSTEDFITNLTFYTVKLTEIE